MVTLHSHATRLGVLDIGSNTVHMLIVDAAPGARPEPEASTKSTIRLMQYLKDDGSIKKAGTEALLSAVEKAMKLAEEYEITQLLVLATSALREAPNGGKILRKIEEAIGQPVTVLSGVDEARLTFLAARRWYGWDAGRLLVIDIGGGSLEVAMGSDEDPTVALSVPAGAGRVTREFLPADHPPVQEPTDVRLRTLAGFAQGCSYRQIGERWLGQSGSPLRVQEVGSYHAILACVAAGTCAGVVPRVLLELQRTPPAVRRVPLLEVDTLLVWRRGYAAPAFRAWREQLSSAT